MDNKYSISSDIRILYDELNIPERLEKHLLIVHKTAVKLLNEINKNWTDLDINSNQVLFGAATHDIGKCIKEDELYRDGSEHEQEGYNLLTSKGISTELSRFTITHAHKDFENLTIEDLVVILADKLWKGKRITELEEAFISKISLKIKTDYWEIYPIIDSIFLEITKDADKLLFWQK